MGVWTPQESNLRYPDWAECPRCGYLLRGCLSARCPECGDDIIRVLDPGAQLVWQSPSGRWWLVAFLDTLLVACFQPRRLANAVYQPLDYTAARRFWWIVVGVVTLLLIGAAALAVSSPGPHDAYSLARVPQAWEWAGWYAYDEPIWVTPYARVVEHLGAPVANAIVIAFAVGLALFPFLATAAPTYFFHPRGQEPEKQNRAICLAYYVSARLLFAIPLAGLLRVATFLLFALYGALAVNPLDWLALDCAALALAFFAYWIGLTGLSLRLFRSRLLAASMALATPILWLLLFGLCVIIIPAIIGYGIFIGISTWG